MKKLIQISLVFISFMFVNDAVSNESKREINRPKTASDCDAYDWIECIGHEHCFWNYDYRKCSTRGTRQ